MAQTPEEKRGEFLLAEAYAGYLLHVQGWDFADVILTKLTQSGIVANIVGRKFWDVEPDKRRDYEGRALLHLVRVIVEKRIKESSGFGGFVNYIDRTIRGAASDESAWHNQESGVLYEIADYDAPDYRDWGTSRVIFGEYPRFVATIALQSIRFCSKDEDSAFSELIIVGLTHGMTKHAIYQGVRDLDQPRYDKLFDYCKVLYQWSRKVFIES